MKTLLIATIAALLTVSPALADTQCWEWADGHVRCTNTDNNTTTTNCWEWAEGHVRCTEE